MKGISITAAGTIEQVEVDPENWPEFSAYFNNDLPDIVRRGPVILGVDGTVMLVADNGRAMGLPVNPVASYLYGTHVHEQPIVGDVLLLGEEMTYDGADFTDLSNPEGLVASLQAIHARLP